MTGAAEIEDARAAVAQLIDLTEREMLDADPAELERLKVARLPPASNSRASTLSAMPTEACASSKVLPKKLSRRATRFQWGLAPPPSESDGLKDALLSRTTYSSCCSSSSSSSARNSVKLFKNALIWTRFSSSK